MPENNSSPKYHGQEMLHPEHLMFTEKSLAFEVARAATEAMEAQQRKANIQYRMNRSGNPEWQIFKQFNH